MNGLEGRRTGGPVESKLKQKLQKVKRSIISPIFQMEKASGQRGSVICLTSHTW